MEQFHDRMVDSRPVLDETCEVQCITKELKLLKCELSDNFVKGCIIAKLPSQRNFVTSPMHLRREFSVEDVIHHMNFGQNLRERTKGPRDLLVQIWCRRIFTSSRETTRSSKILPSRRVRRTTRKILAATLVVMMDTGPTDAHRS